MNVIGTINRFLSASMRPWCINVRRAIYAVVTVWLGLVFCGPVHEALALPTADELLQELQISASDQQRIRDGNIVTWTGSEGSNRELALGMAVLVKTKAENILQLFREARAFNTMESVFTAHGRIAGDGTSDDFSDMKLEPNGEKEARRYLNAEPGDILNLDSQEIAAFRALRSAGKDGAVPIQMVEALIRQQLLARYQAYQKKGLAGIAPYERKGGHRILASEELSSALKQSKLVAKYLPSVYDAVFNYPAAKIKDGKLLEDQYYWLNLELSGRPLYLLSHRMLFRVDEAYVVVDRHFYASHDYNSLQQGIVLLPAKDGMLVTYVRRVSTDQVGGVGSGAKRAVARALMAPHIKDLLEAVRAKAEKQ